MKAGVVLLYPPPPTIYFEDFIHQCRGVSLIDAGVVYKTVHGVTKWKMKQKGGVIA
jgi:hypothetical protein